MIKTMFQINFFFYYKCFIMLQPEVHAIMILNKMKGKTF